MDPNRTSPPLSPGRINTYDLSSTNGSHRHHSLEIKYCDEKISNKAYTINLVHKISFNNTAIELFCAWNRQCTSCCKTIFL